MPDAVEEALPVLFQHCQEAYRRMLEQATVRQGDDGEDLIVYEGYPTKLIVQEMNLSTPYYTYVMQALKRMGCVRQLRRGGGTAPSQLELIKEPEEESFRSGQPLKKPRNDKLHMQQAQINELNRRVSTLEQALQSVISEEQSNV